MSLPSSSEVHHKLENLCLEAFFTRPFPPVCCAQVVVLRRVMLPYGMVHRQDKPWFTHTTAIRLHVIRGIYFGAAKPHHHVPL